MVILLISDAAQANDYKTKIGPARHLLFSFFFIYRPAIFKVKT